MLKALVLTASMFVAGNAYADEVVIHRDGPIHSEDASKTVETHRSADGCSSKTVHKENGMGDSTTIKKSDC